MTIRSAWFVVGAAMAAGCNGQEIHAGSNAAGAAAPPTGVSSTSGAEEGGTTEGGGSPGRGSTMGNGGSAQNGEGGSNLVATVPIRTCASGPPSTAAPSGHTAIAPIECSEALGPAHPVASAADVASLLPGTWSACAGPVFGLPVSMALGVELTSDGQYRLLGGAPDSKDQPNQ